MRIYKLQIAVLILLPLLGASCINSSGVTRVGGIHITEDAGKTWVASNNIISDAGTDSLARFDIIDLLLDPTDNNILYAATGQSGLYKSIDGAKSWNALTTKGRIESIDVHKKDTSLLVAARGNQIFISKNSGEVWDLAYTDPANILITNVKFHTISTGHIFASTNAGTLLESTDQGRSWRLLFDFDKSIKSIATHPKLATSIFILLDNGRIQYSENTGKTFKHITEGLISPILSTNPVEFLVHPKEKNQILYATTKGIYKTTNLGQDWVPLPLLSTANESIQSIGWDPQKLGLVYYATPSIFYRSTDGGTTWETNIFTSSRLPKKILVHPENSDILIIATKSE